MTEQDEARAPEEEDGGTTPPTGTVDAATTVVDPEAGLATAEYAVATVAAVGFAGLLIAVLKSDTVRGLLEAIISSALSV